MKFVKNLGLLFLGAWVFISCQKEYSVETGGLGGSTGTAQWEFKEGSMQFRGTMDTASRDTLGGIEYLTLEGISDSGNQRIFLEVYGTRIQANTFTPPAVTFKYTDLSSNIIYQNDILSAGGFTLTISKIDSVSVSGTFSGNVTTGTSAAKTVTNGKFTAFFKKSTTTPPPPGTSNCKIEKILQYDSAGVGRGPVTIFTYNPSNRVSKVQVVDSVLNATYATFNLSFPTNKIQLDATQYFTTDASGKATEYRGYEDPTDNTTDKIIATYSYNAAGQLSQRRLAYDSAPTRNVLTIDYTWTGNNMTKAEGKVQAAPGISVTVFDVTYQYDNTKPVKNFLTLPAYAYEITFFQPAVITGPAPVNALTKTTSRYYNPTNNSVTGTYVCNFINYRIDANNYVQNFITSGDDFDEAFIFAGSKYVFNYKCF